MFSTNWVLWLIFWSLTVQGVEQGLILFRLRHLEDPHQVVFTIPQINFSAQEIACP